MKIPDDKRGELQKLLDKLFSGGKHCPVCGTDEWVVDETLFALTEFHKLDAMIGGARKPLIAAMCTNCGYVLLMSAIKLGIIPAWEEVFGSGRGERRGEEGKGGSAE